MAALLVRRGYTGVEEARRFLHPLLKTLGDPFELAGMRAAVDRIFAALDAGRRLVLYGDYDVDGVTSLALLARMLRAYGADPACFLPRRMEEGYGLSREGITRCVEEHRPGLLIAVDCGTASAPEIEELEAGGVEVIVLDHHECQEAHALPRCAALVNPKQPGGAIGEAGETGEAHRALCSAGIVFKLCHGLLKTRPLDVAQFDLREHLDLIALGTVADLVPLTGENRILVRRGLAQMEETRWPGLRALMEKAGVSLPLKPSDVGFQLGPRLNAAGRLGEAEEALELLLTEDPARARQLAERLDTRNRERQRVEKETHEAAQRQVGDPAAHAALVVGGDGWHPGVLGIVASRLSRAFHRPAFVVGFDEDGVGKGSGRSIAGLSLMEALEACGPLLEKFGGHEMAAGITVRRERFEAFRERFLERARALLTEEALQPTVRLDGEIALGEVDLAFLESHERLQPFGIGNAQPLWLARGVCAAGAPVVLKEKHLRLTLAQEGAEREAIFFNALPEELPPPPWDVAFRIERNAWRGRVSVQMQIQGIRSVRSPTA